jgi:hypothetical protein
MKGEVVYLYAFDVADEIVTARVQALLAKKPVPFEVRSDRTLPRDVPLYKPLAIEPAPLVGARPGQLVRLLIRLYEIGVVTIAMRVAFEVGTLADLVPFHRPVLASEETLDQAARRLCAAICRDLKDLMIRRSPLPEPEAYTIFCLTELGPVPDSSQWLQEQRRAVAGLLSETEPDRLSEAQVNEVLRIHYSFATTDLVVIDWDAALVVDLSGYVEDVLYTLELANLQLEEFRIMDQRLDAYLNRAYTDLERRRRPLLGVPTRLLRALRRLRMDVTKLSDEVTHITKFFGDWYLARVYLGARERFHLDHWRGSVDRRLLQLDQLYSVVQGEVSDQRMLWLEAAIVVLFVVDLLAVFFFK